MLFFLGEFEGTAAELCPRGCCGVSSIAPRRWVFAATVAVEFEFFVLTRALTASEKRATAT